MSQLKNNILAVCFTFLASLIIISCYEHEKGCRDINALNFSVSADEECDDNCCTYPNVEFIVNFIYKNSVIDTSTYFPITAGDSIRLKSAKIFFSDFSFSDESGNREPVYYTNLLGISTNGVTEYKEINSSVIKVKPENSKYAAGTMRTLFRPNTLMFQFGLNDMVNFAMNDKLTTSSPLYSKSTDSMFVDNNQGYYFFKINIQDKKNPLNLKKIVALKPPKNISFSFSSEFNFSLRQTHQIKINIDLEKLFSEVHLSDSQLSIRDKILKNIISSVALSD
jgi:hypothetical protein